jgi:RsiW-degrading membrane proteinase PrsW (M82 family)
MSGLPVLALLILASALPAFLAFLWFRLARFPLSPLRCACALLTGAAALFPALLLQRILPGADPELAGRVSRGALLFALFRIPLTEELGRLLALLVFFLLSREIPPGPPPSETGVSSETGVRGAALGLLAGLGFALLESAAYGASDFRVTLPRAFTAAPLHAACGARIGSGLHLFRDQPRSGIFRFSSALIIHGAYNITVAQPGLPTLLAVLIALTALASSALEIQKKVKGKS